jgi:tryptophan-rich sensory protein
MSAAPVEEAVIPQVNWDLLMQPSEWYIRPDVIMENSTPLLISLGVALLAFVLFLVARSRGVDDPWWRNMKRTKLAFSPTNFILLWGFFYIPLAVSAWLIYIHSGNQWTRPLTVYAAHLCVNVLFAVSLWWVRDLSLALLNLVTLLGVAMFTSTQFSSILHFASVINIPYLFWLLYCLVDFGYFWYLNEGKDMLDVNQLKGIVKKKKKAFGIPEQEKERIKEKIAAESSSSTTKKHTATTATAGADANNKSEKRD